MQATGESGPEHAGKYSRRRPRLKLAEVNYRPRIIACLLIALMQASIPEDRLTHARWGLAVFFLAWPHIAYWWARRSRDGNRAEAANILVDFFLGGLLAAAFSFRLWPTTTIFVIGLINALIIGGPRLLLIGLMALGLGLLTALASFGIDLHPDTEVIPTVLSIVAIICYVALFSNTVYRLRLRQRETRAALEREERKAHELLLKVLPEAVIPRLKAGQSPIADQFADVTVVFADIVEFTPLSERLGPKRMVLLLNDLFGRFDHAASQLGVEKIETTGDGYLAVGGAPEPLDRHAEAVAEFALALVDAARIVPVSETEQVRIRVGIHTGPVFAGVIGESRFHYKIFGETVNTASRIQGQSQAGRILVSEATFKRLQGTFGLEEHGTVELKGHGPMRTYWLLSRSTSTPFQKVT